MKAQGDVDSLKQLLKAATTDTARLSLLNALVEALPDGEWEPYNMRMKMLAANGVEISGTDKKLQNTYLHFLGFSTYNQGVEEGMKGNYPPCLDYFRQSFEISTKLGDKQSMAGALREMAKTNDFIGNDSVSIDLLFKSLWLYEELNDKEGLGDVYLYLGRLYYKKLDYSKSTEFFGKANEAYKTIHHSSGMYEALYRTAYGYMSTRQYEKALEYFNKSYGVLDSAGREQEAVVVSNNIALVYVAEHQYGKAIAQFRNSLKIAGDNGDSLRETNCLMLLGETYAEKGDYLNAVKYSEAALKKLEKSVNKEDVYLTQYHLYQDYKNLGNYRKALEMHELFLVSKKEMDNKETERQLLEQHLKYDYSKKEWQARNDNEKRITALKLTAERDRNRKNIWIIVLISISLVLFAGSLFLYNYFRQKNLIARQKENILKQKLLASQMNPHFIFNSLNAIQNYIFKQDSLKAGTYLSQFAELMRMILDYSRRDLIKLSEEIKLVNNYLELQQLRFDFRFDYSIEIGEDIKPSEVLIPPMLAQPFIENAIEHGIFYKESKGNIYLRISKKEDKLVYEIEDDGVGLKKSAELKKGSKPAHTSHAISITQERFYAMEGISAATGSISITDLSAESPASTGVRVLLEISLHEIL
jgi:tetratricopeptide (TPR) repeat protein